MKNNKIWDYKSKESKGEICDALAELVEKKGNNIVMTKATMAKYLIDRITWKPGELVCEPCKGDGAFYDNLPDYVIKSWFEINEGRDYLGAERMCVNTTISNPPFVPRKLFWNLIQLLSYLFQGPFLLLPFYLPVSFSPIQACYLTGLSL